MLPETRVAQIVAVEAPIGLRNRASATLGQPIS